MYIPQDEQATLYDFFVYTQIFGKEDERNEQAADHADPKTAERERASIFLNSEREQGVFFRRGR